MPTQKNNVKTSHPKKCRIWFMHGGCLAAITWCWFLAACKPLPNIQGKGDFFMQGIWNQDSIANQNKLISYTQHRFKFTCDSFYVDLTTHAKVNYYADECFNKGIWKEYAKGVYQVRNDSLFLVGDFTKSNYKQKISGCYRSGRYLVNFIIKSSTKTQLVFENLTNERIYTLSLKNPIICTQKPL